MIISSSEWITFKTENFGLFVFVVIRHLVLPLIILFYFHMESVKKPSKSTKLWEWPLEIGQYWIVGQDQPYSFWNVPVRRCCPAFKSTMLPVRGVGEFCKALQSKLKARFQFLQLIMEMRFTIVFHKYLCFLQKLTSVSTVVVNLLKYFKMFHLKMFSFTKQWLNSLYYHLRSILLTI